jgi:carboxyl-terminal processing protease
MKEKIELNKSKIISSVIIGTLIVLISSLLIYSFVTVLKPIIKGDEFNLKSSSSDKVTSEDLARIKEAIERVSENYIGDTTIEDLVDGAVAGVANATGDPYTRYVSEDEYHEMLTSGTEKYYGIGVHITYDSDAEGILVLGVMPSSPALEADIKAGDVIIQVADKVVTADNYKDCVDLIKGEQGTNVKIVVRRNNENIEKNIERREVSSNNIESKVLDSNIGYIKIWSFENDIYKQFKTEYDKLISQNVSGLIIDVRNNPGGLVSETLDICRLLLPQGDILKLVNKSGEEKVYKDTDNNEINIPLAIIANSRSASASEILSAAIKDSGKGILVGNKTYGKGIVQSVEALGNRGALSITTAKYYTSSGIEIHKNGIEPNITVNLPDEYKNEIVIPFDKDTQLQSAIEYINSKK